MSFKSFVWTLTGLLTATSFSLALDEAPLDPAYHLRKGVVSTRLLPEFDLFRRELRLPEISDFARVIGFQTPVKSQGGRGVCSIFSATGILESLLKIRDGQEFDLSENYLVYTVMSRMKPYPSAGSNSYFDINGLKNHGTILETDWPYETQEWFEGELDESEQKKADATCGEFKGRRKKACLLTHRDPEADPDEEKALDFREINRLADLKLEGLYSEEAIKKTLSEGRPLLLSIDFFYKAWNHRKMVEYGLGERDMDAWYAGKVGIPDEKDLKVAEEHSAGHSIVVVGYNDAEKVYYFKNSWGQEGFGKDSDFLGKSTTAGYGTIPYGYANDYGSFFAVDFETNSGT